MMQKELYKQKVVNDYKNYIGDMEEEIRCIASFGLNDKAMTNNTSLLTLICCEVCTIKK